MVGTAPVSSEQPKCVEMKRMSCYKFAIHGILKRKKNNYNIKIYKHKMEMVHTFSSGIENTPITSDISVLPNSPSWPWSFSPVNVWAIFQNFICPDPAVTKWPGINEDKLQMRTSWVCDFVVKIITDSFQSHTVSVLSGSPPCEHKYWPFLLKKEKKKPPNQSIIIIIPHCYVR